MFNSLRKESVGSIDNLRALLNIPLADVFDFDNFSAHIISDKGTSTPEAMSLQIASKRRRY